MDLINTLLLSSDTRLRVDLVSTLAGVCLCDIATRLDEALEIMEHRKSRGERVAMALVDLDSGEREANDLLAALTEKDESLRTEEFQNIHIIAVSDSERRVLSAFFHGAEGGHVLPLDKAKLLE